MKMKKSKMPHFLKSKKQKHFEELEEKIKKGDFLKIENINKNGHTQSKK